MQTTPSGNMNNARKSGTADRHKFRNNMNRARRSVTADQHKYRNSMNIAKRSVTADRHKSGNRISKIDQEMSRSRNAVSAGGGPRSGQSFFSTKSRVKRGAQNKKKMKDEATLLPIEWRCQMPPKRHDEVHAAVIRSRRALESAERVSRAIKAAEQNYFENVESEVWGGKAVLKSQQHNYISEANGSDTVQNEFNAAFSRPGTGALPTSEAFPAEKFPMTGLPLSRKTGVSRTNKSAIILPKSSAKPTVKATANSPSAPRTNQPFHILPINLPCFY